MENKQHKKKYKREKKLNAMKNEANRCKIKSKQVQSGKENDIKERKVEREKNVDGSQE